MAMTQPTATKPASVQSSIEDFDPVLGRLEQLAHRAGAAADRISGSRPQGVEAKADSPAPNHVIWAIQSRRERLISAVDYLEGEMNRIESSLS